MTRLLILLWLASAPAFAGGLEQLKSFFATSHSMRGSFTQTVIAQNGRKPQQSAGIFAVQRPGKFRWSYEQPYVQLLVSDGKTLWSWDPDLKQVVVKKVGQLLGGSPAELLAGGELEKNFELAESTARDGLEFVDAKPRKADASFSLMRIGMTGNLPVQMEIHDNFGQVTQLRLNRIESNPALATELFRFKPPAGADVVGE
jgi:outer membrane lipoprotein carrier protein